MGSDNVHWVGVVALDGPSGTGKSTVARRLAGRLDAAYLDTGATYRAATLAVLRAGASLDDEAAIAATVARARIEVSPDPATQRTWLDGAEVEAEIRGAEVTAAVSAVSAVGAVRVQLVDYQQRIIRQFVARQHETPSGIVVEGRDIASVVWPQARPKVYLTASAHARARRRAAELDAVALDAVAADIARRDHLDSTRQASPLARASDAVLLDTTELNIDEVVDRLVDLTLRT